MDRRLLERLFYAIGGDGCWEWQGTIHHQGYGVIRIGDRIHRAHRVVYEATVAPIADGFVLDHLCENKRCVNPAHLEPVTHAENVRRAWANKPACRNGHLYTPENTGRKPNGSRRCRACARAAQQRVRDRLVVA